MRVGRKDEPLVAESNHRSVIHGPKTNALGGHFIDTIDEYPLDELPLVAVLGSFAEGITEVCEAEELRGKESDRIATSCEMIRALGGGAEESHDGFQIVGLGWLEGGTVDSHTDHRIAMAFSVAALAADGDSEMTRAEAASVSFPEFYDTLDSLRV